KVGATKQEIDYEFNSPGTSKELGDGKTDVTYKYEIGNSSNPGRAGVNAYIDLATIGLAEPILTLIEFLQGKNVETGIVYGPDNRDLEIYGYSRPLASEELKAAQEAQELYTHKRLVTVSSGQQRMNTPPSSLNASPSLQPSDVDVLPVIKTGTRKN